MKVTKEDLQTMNKLPSQEVQLLHLKLQKKKKKRESSLVQLMIYYHNS